MTLVVHETQPAAEVVVGTTGLLDEVVATTDLLDEVVAITGLLDEEVVHEETQCLYSSNLSIPKRERGKLQKSGFTHNLLSHPSPSPSSSPYWFSSGE